MEGYKFRVCGNGGQHYYSIINDKYLTRFSVPLHPKPQLHLILLPERGPLREAIRPALRVDT